jgi:hypothetical protein
MSTIGLPLLRHEHRQAKVFRYLCKNKRDMVKMRKVDAYVSFLNPFGKQEAKIRLFNVYFYSGETHNNLTIDILNLTFSFYFWKTPSWVKDLSINGD